MINKIKNQAFLAKQKSILLTEKARVKEELKGISKFPQYGDTEEANAQEIERFEGYKGMEKQLKTFLAEINHALSTFDSNTYGECNKCHNPIDENRLDAFPAANVCVKCASKK